jgi:hypothetical protein
MKYFLVVFALLLSSAALFGQTNPAITSWLQNTTNIMGRHYVKGNSVPINDNVLANVKTVQYSATSVYVSANGIPAYVTGPFLDGNPSLATNQNAIFRLPLYPTKNTGNPTNTNGGNIGLFINGVALFDYRDGVSWHNSTGTLKGGPLMGMGDGVWNRDAVVGERLGFDCAKAHPAMGNYHHHQNPSAFSLDLKVISNVCDLYAADGLYAIDSTKHSPLIGFAYDGFPIYGAYAHKNTDGTGGIVRMKSSYSLRSITMRTQYANGSTVTSGPSVNTTYPLGYFREDYQYNTTTSSTPDYLDEHNGRFCVTPEYPDGIYCYFATVDENWNSAYPYVVGPTFYGIKTAAKVTAIGETVTTYTPTLGTNTLTVSTNIVSLPAEANNNKTVDVRSNIAWKATSNQAWLTLSSTADSANKTITLIAEDNIVIAPRTATVTVSGNGVVSQLITVVQRGVGPMLNISTNTISIPAPANNSKSFNVISNTKWNAVCNQTWLTLSSLSGTGDTSITLIAQANPDSTMRTATITVSATGASSQIVNAVQEAKASMSEVSNLDEHELTVNVFPNPSNETIAIQLSGTKGVQSRILTLEFCIAAPTLLRSLTKNILQSQRLLLRSSTRGHLSCNTVVFLLFGASSYSKYGWLFYF